MKYLKKNLIKPWGFSFSTLGTIFENARRDVNAKYKERNVLLNALTQSTDVQA